MGVMGTKVFTFQYNSDGLRSFKRANNKNHYYYYDGDRLIAEKLTTGYILYHYDENDSIYCITYNNGTSDSKYYLIKNLQGDVVEIWDSANSVVARYYYDAWGNLVSVLNGTGANITSDTTHIAYINPIRYRGYYYDAETSLYYLQSRYYDPAIGRFISADSLLVNDPSAYGYNLFAYCGNDPVNNVDPSGHWPQWIKDAANWIDSNILKPVSDFVNDVKEDWNNFDKSNTSEETVLKSNYFSCYKGVPVIRTDFDRSGSFGAIFLKRKTNNFPMEKAVAEVQHEYGHTIQMEQIGCIDYLLGIGIPSWQEWGSGSYYNKPWEITADIYGGVTYRNHTEQDIEAGFDYLRTIKFANPYEAWKTID